MLKKQTLRNNEYYDLQPELDNLFQQSKENAKFNNLLPLITDSRNIKLAYRNIKRNAGSATAGVDKKTIVNWSKSQTAGYVQYVRDRLNNYQPQNVRRVEIPKDNGGVRPLGIPTIGDRLIQQCIKQILEPICEAKFHRSSYGFRPNRNQHHAIAEMYNNIQVRNLYHVVDIDIKGFFDNVDHGKLLKQMWTLGIRDKNLLSIISKMLKAEITGIGIPEKGTPQGGILSPLLSNIVLNELDWWISDQFETFETEKVYANKNNSEYVKYQSLRTTTTLKEIYILRFADDFKLFCKTKQMAKKAFIATEQWLKERLRLEISQEKSTIVDIRKQASAFLGIEITTQSPRKKRKEKQRKFVVQSNMLEKAKKKVRDKLKERIIDIQKAPNDKLAAQAVNKYNATVLGQQNYYKIATHVNLDMNEITFIINRNLHNRLRKRWSKSGVKTKTYNKFYKNNYTTHYIAGIPLFPLGDVQTKFPQRYNQKVCNYTQEGRDMIHKNLSDKHRNYMIIYLMRTAALTDTVELNDNKISKYVGQKGRCHVTGAILQIGYMDIHHITPVSLGGTDEYKNLVWVTDTIHILIHATVTSTINQYLKRLNLTQEQRNKLNKLRVKAGNLAI